MTQFSLNTQAMTKTCRKWLKTWSLNCLKQKIEQHLSSKTENRGYPDRNKGELLVLAISSFPALPLPNATWIAYFSGFHCLLLQLLRLIWSFSMNIMLYVLHSTSRCHATPQNSSVWCKQSNSATLLFLFSQSTSKLNSWIRIYYNVTRAKTKMQTLCSGTLQSFVKIIQHKSHTGWDSAHHGWEPLKRLGHRLRRFWETSEGFQLWLQ